MGPKTTYRRLFGYALRQRRRLALIAGLTAVAGVLAAVQPLPLKILVDYGLSDIPPPPPLRTLLESLAIPAAPASFVIFAAIAGLGVFAVTSAIDTALGWLWAVAGQNMVYSLAGDLFHRLQRLSLLFHSRQSVGDSLSRLTTDTWCVYTFTSELLMAPLQHVMTLASIGLLAWYLDPRLALICLGSAPLLAGAAFYFGKRLKKRARLSKEARARLTSFVQQTLTAMPLVKVFGAERRNSLHYQSLSADVVRWERHGALLTSGFGMTNGVIVSTGIALVLFSGGLQVMAGAMALGTLLVFLGYMRTLQQSVQGLLRIYGSLKPLEASIDRIFEVLDSPETVKDPAVPAQFPDRSVSERNRVELRDVWFGYEPDRPALRNINLTVEPGETVALVGRTGAGKTTLSALLLRFFDPDQGQVRIGGRDIRDYKLADLRANLSIVPQEALLLPGTISKNISYSRPEATSEEIHQAARLANAHEFIESLPDGYDTVLGERGLTLSGGERQRLTIARAFLKDAPILILDEPSSALDTRSEWTVTEALEQLRAGRTTFIIAHRLSTVRNADKVVVLDEGTIVEIGTHDDLIARNGQYARFYRLLLAPPHEGAVA